MKAIAITARLLENISYPEVREALDIRWGAFLYEAELLPVVLPVEFFEIEHFFKELSISGIIFTGGNNLSLWTDNPLTLKRDRFEKKLLAFAIEQNFPVLGICRGAQIIADFFDTKLQQAEGHVATRHHLKIDYSSRYSHLFSGLSEVNSYHNYAITKLSSSLRSVAFAEDDSIEAIEHKDFPVLGVMWHPEREQPFRREEVKLFREFFK